MAANPAADHPPAADAQELMVTYRRKLMSLGTEIGTDVADVRGTVVGDAAPLAVVLAAEVERGAVDPGAGVEEGLEEEQAATPRRHAVTTRRATLEPDIKTFFSASESLMTRLGDSQRRASRCPRGRPAPS